MRVYWRLESAQGCDAFAGGLGFRFGGFGGFGNFGMGLEVFLREVAWSLIWPLNFCKGFCSMGPWVL